MEKIASYEYFIPQHSRRRCTVGTVYKFKSFTEYRQDCAHAN